MREVLIATCLAAGAAHAEAPRVVADIAPVHSLVAMVMEGVGEPALLVPPGASPHDHAMRPSEARALEGADVLVWMGDGLAPWLGRAAERLAPEAALVSLPELDGAVVLPAREGAVHDHHGHDHGDTDPHGWLDPRNAAVWVGAVAEALAEIDPDNAETYRGNAAEAGRELEALEAEIDAALEPFRGTPYIVLHDALQYFEARFDVPAVAAVAAGDAADPGPSRVREVEGAVEGASVACAFAEPQLDPGLLSVVAEEVPTGVIDPLGVGLEPGPDLYPELLKDIAEAMTGCL